MTENRNADAGNPLDGRVNAHNPTVEGELERRRILWNALLDRGGPREVPPRVLRDLGIYGGAQGIWIDKGRTSNWNRWQKQQ